MKIAGECIKRMDASVTASIEERLEESLNYPTKSILETLGNIIAENDLYATYLLENGYLGFLSRVYFDKNNNASSQSVNSHCFLEIKESAAPTVWYTLTLMD